MIVKFVQIENSDVKNAAKLKKKDIGKWSFVLENEVIGIFNSQKEAEDYFFGNKKSLLKARNKI